MPQIAGSLATPLPRHAPTLAQSILDRVAATPDRLAYRYPTPDGDWGAMTWREAGDEMRTLGAGLVSLGLQPEDRVAIASNTRLEWILADGALTLAGGANTTLYPSTGADDFGYIVADSGARLLVAEDQAQADKALHQRDRLPELTRIILIDGEGDGDFVLSWAQLKERGLEALAKDPALIEGRVAGVTPQSLSTIIYTSGTTGRPKGVELTHGNWVFQGASIEALDIMHIDDLHYLWLPLAHSFGKLLIAAQYQIGLATAVDGRIDQIIVNLPVVKPTLMCGVPRIFEKIYSGANAKAKAGGGAKAKIFDWAFTTSAGIKAKQRAGTSAGPLAGVQMAVADKLVFSKIRQATGGRMRLHATDGVRLRRAQRGRGALVRRGRHAGHRGLRADRELSCRVHRAPGRHGVRGGGPALPRHRGDGCRGWRDPAARSAHHAWLPEPAGGHR